MTRAIWSSVSGLDNHQTWMDVLGNNIANVNTAGYKDGRFEFEDILSQSIRGASPAVQGGLGGTNPEQVGLGTNTGSVDTITTQGSLQPTNVPTDLAIAGNGYFIVSDGLNQHFTRDGIFHVDGAGNLVSAATGLHLQGIVADQSGTLQFNRGLQNLTLPQTVNSAQNTTLFDAFGNLDSRADPNKPPLPQQQITVYDSLGQAHTVVLTFTPTAAGSGNWSVSATSADLNTAAGASITVTNSLTGESNTTGGTTANLHFNGQGQLVDQNGGTVPAGTTVTLELAFNGPNNNGVPTPWLLSGGAASNALQPLAPLAGAPANTSVTIQLNDAQVGSLTSFAAPTSITSQISPGTPNGAGNAAGFFKSFSVDKSGVIRGTYSNGTTKILGQIELATFTNPGGLERIGQNDWDLSSNSGQANVAVPDSGAAGAVVQGSIETSNVDLANELAQVILAQRGFTANSRMVTTSDEMLQDVVAMKR